ncbi:hypothetical protein EJ06DRAFT_466714, partial [Trichodelitschia bisporula]
AHMIMRTPPAFFKASTSPLGSVSPPIQFPCQGGASATYDFGNATQATAGGTVPVSFIGSAVHGGGSCQLSLATTASADPKNWHVVHSIMGGCVASAKGNLDRGPDTDGYPDAVECSAADSDAQSECKKKWNIPLPQGLPSGKYLFAWTWFNTVGNREMYMNCAPIEVKGASGSQDDFLKTLPGIFMANVEAQPCVTKELPGLSLPFPDPGTSV